LSQHVYYFFLKRPKKRDAWKVFTRINSIQFRFSRLKEFKTVPSLLNLSTLFSKPFYQTKMREKYHLAYHACKPVFRPSLFEKHLSYCIWYIDPWPVIYRYQIDLGWKSHELKLFLGIRLAPIESEWFELCDHYQITLKCLMLVKNLKSKIFGYKFEGNWFSNLISPFHYDIKQVTFFLSNLFFRCNFPSPIKTFWSKNTHMLNKFKSSWTNHRW
jgi:hypothetical protein